jgi:hypothetical protein
VIGVKRAVSDKDQVFRRDVFPEKINFLKRTTIPMRKKHSKPSKNRERRIMIERLIKAKGTVDLNVDLDIVRDRKNLFGN